MGISRAASAALWVRCGLSPGADCRLRNNSLGGFGRRFATSKDHVMMIHSIFQFAVNGRVLLLKPLYDPLAGGRVLKTLI